MTTKEHPIKLGWCLSTGIEQHRKCHVTSGKYTCECTTCGDQHGVDKEILPSGITPELRKIMEQYGMMDEKTRGRAKKPPVVPAP